MLEEFKLILGIDSEGLLAIGQTLENILKNVASHAKLTETVSSTMCLFLLRCCGSLIANIEIVNFKTCSRQCWIELKILYDYHDNGNTLPGNRNAV